jgi:hypothetical protein
MVGFPAEGTGRRYLWCKNYDDCLDFAENKDWRCFNCDLCGNQDLGQMSWTRPVLIPDYSEEDLLFEEDWESVVCWDVFHWASDDENINNLSLLS